MNPTNRPQEQGAGQQGGNFVNPGTPTLPAAGATTTQSESDPWNPPKRYYRDESTGQLVFGNVSGIVNGKTGKVTPYYDIDLDPIRLWYGLTPAKRDSIITAMQAKGYSMRTLSEQQSGFRTLLVNSNALGQDYDTVLLRLGSIRSTGSGGGGPSYRVSNPMDIKSVAEQVFRATLGRAATQDEANRFVQFFQQEQIRGQQGSTAAPQADVAAQEFARANAPKEAAAYQMLNYMNAFANVARGAE